MASITNEQIGFYVFLNAKLLDVLVFLETGSTVTIKIPISPHATSTEMVKIIVKTLGTQEISIGSITIP